MFATSLRTSQSWIIKVISIKISNSDSVEIKSYVQKLNKFPIELNQILPL